MALLEAEKITKRFGGVVALDNASFNCDSGTITALVGENGAGKSTMVKVICGVYRPDGGEVRLKSQVIQPHNPADAARLGIVSVYQELSLMPHLTVAQNIWLSDPPHNSIGLIDFKEQTRRTDALLSGLGFPPHRSPTRLSLTCRWPTASWWKLPMRCSATLTC